ncbi:hypothetical protein HELRODRAFT_91013 [Helobdella robusta]|uniref:ABC transporter domain-containing protein n=1 Tax=Helobdella robusta TaxID=6412 RepID=T1G7Y6_HELRO|nr:hypothetical protein HELRODRAFT_91013 [Helobdella robusta]ESN90117.1 hypothetical protein HELRODRAFT_91013 [Helobdella robusta]
MYHEPAPLNAREGISIVNLVKKFKKKLPAAVDHLTVTFYYDQITSFLGHNGAGKTTAMSIMAGMLRGTSGKVFVDGYDVEYNMDEIRRNFSLCPQHDLLFDPLTIRQHMLFFGRLKGLTKDECLTECNRLTLDLNLFNKIDTPAKELSGGMKRLLSIGLAYLGSPRIIILDEPSTGVDAHTRRAIWNLLQAYRAGGTTVISTHAMDEADIVSDRIAIIWHGQLCCSGSPMFLKKTFSKGYRLTIELDGWLVGRLIDLLIS